MTQNRKTMILISKIKPNSLLLLFSALLVAIPFGSSAQTAVSLSISPTLFEVSADPGQSLTSSLRVINANPFEIRIFSDVVNFTPQGESGQGSFIPVFSEESQGQTVAEWIEAGDSEIIIPAEQTMQVPFTITVPADAAPGGHFAAILIGTKAQRTAHGQMKVETSQVISSLIFLRVSGDIIENGSIREFISERTIYESPEVTFDLRFENKGNVHLQPQGDIKILNMWGQERGIIPVNRQSLFGNVLPESIRKYRFTWTGEWSLADIGRYRAVATLAYGEEARQFTTSETAFWVIPWRVLGSIALVLLGFILLFTWAIKLYIRKMLLMAGMTPEIKASRPVRVPTRRVSVVAPFEAGILDLRTRLQNADTVGQKTSVVLTFIKLYKVFFIVLVAFIVFVVLVVSYIKTASVSDRAFEVRVDGAAGQIQFTAEDVRYNQLVEAESNDGVVVVDSKEFPQVQLVNRSGLNGLAGELKYELEVNGYPVANVINESGTSETKTVIIYSPKYAEEALELSQFIGETLLSAYPDEDEQEYPITIYIGSDQQSALE